MSDEEIKIVDDKLFVYTPIPEGGGGIYKVQLVMTKEIFQECYRRWIEPQEKSTKMRNDDQGRVSIDPEVIKQDRELQIRNIKQ